MHWAVLTIVPLACIAIAGLGLVLGTKFEPRNIGLMFGFIVLPITFLGGTYYAWTTLAPVRSAGSTGCRRWCYQPADLCERRMRAALTKAPHMHLYVVYPVVAGFAVLSLSIGLHNFARRVLS